MIGAAYLAYLGLKLFRAGGAPAAESRRDAAGVAGMIAHAGLVTALNPKSITFFVAFLPQFIDRSATLLPAGARLRDDVSAAGFRQCSGLRLRSVDGGGGGRKFAHRHHISRTGGTLLIGAGLATLALHAAKR